jgi:hypothetical protein
MDDLNKINISDNSNANGVSILHINAQSVKNKLDLLEVEAGEHDIVTLSETWLHQGIENEHITMEGFQPPVRRDRGTDRYGGVAIYCKSSLPIKQRPDIHTEGVESIWAEIVVGDKKILVGTIYRPPDEPNAYWNKLQENLEQAKDSGISTIIVTGDLNCNLLNPKNKLQAILDNMHMEQLVKVPTHYTDNNATLLDIIATTSSDLVVNTMVEAPSLSNHCDVSVYLSTSKPRAENFQKKIYKYDQADWPSLRNDISHYDWNDILSSPNVDDQVEKWTEEYQNLIDKNIPHKMIRITESNNEWMNTNILNLRKTKATKHKKAQKSKKESDWRKYREAREKLEQVIREAKKEHVERLAEKIRDSHQRDEKLWWKLAKRFYNRTNNNRHMEPPLIIDNRATTSTREKAEAFKEYFSNACKIDVDPNVVLPDPPEDLQEQIRDVNFTALDVKNVLQNLDTNKAKGPDNISAKVLKETASETAPLLARIFNYSMRNKSFPKTWKLANVTPVYKKGDKSEPKNFRPVSLLSIVGKTMERCIFNVMIKYLEDNNRLSSIQAAYRPGYSTTTQLIEVYNFIQNAMDHGKEGVLIFCDMSKAFDRVWHQGLLHKLASVGIRGELLDWCARDRKSVV